MTKEQNVETQLKANIVVGSQEVDQAKLCAEPSDTGIKPARVVEEPTSWLQPSESDVEMSDVNLPNAAEKSGMGSKWFWLFAIIVTLAGVELALFIEYVLSASDYLAAAWLSLFVVIFGFAISQLVGQWRGLKQLKQSEKLKQQAQNYITSPSIGSGVQFCEKASRPIEHLYPEDMEKWRKTITPQHLDSEVIKLFDGKVLCAADEKALRYVSRHSSASAAMIAVSPFALLDMAIVLWRNLVMINQISECYGIKLSYWGRISLIKRIFKTMLVAGAAEIVSDAGNYALGTSVTGKLSSRLAQGLGAGVLTTRIGLKAMHACRPIPWIANKPPGVTAMVKRLRQDLQSLSGGS